MMNIKKGIYSMTLVIGLTSSCNNFLDIVPDNAPVLEQAFAMRSMAENYLATCYSSIPSRFSTAGEAGLLAGDEFWLSSEATYSTLYNWQIALGNQNGDQPLLNFWDGNNGGNSLWIGITNCNTFLENIMSVPDMNEIEQYTWAAEVKVLKAYYHFSLVKRYGPIPIRDVNIPVSAPPGESQLPRNSVDDCFDYIVGLIDESMPDLMQDVLSPNTETGRITQLVATALKAEILIYAASPLFNGNFGLEASISNSDGEMLFNQTFSLEKWQAAATACKEAIDLAHSLGRALHTWTPYNPGNTYQASTHFQMNAREAFNESSGNVEHIWIDSRSIATGATQGIYMLPRYTANATSGSLLGYMSVTLNIVEKFYSKNGVPIDEDIEYPYSTRYNLITVPGTDDYRFDLVAGRQTARINLDREPRFYGSLVFDAGRLYMNQVGSDASAYNIDVRLSGASGKVNPNNYNWTGYASKKHYNYRNEVAAGSVYTARSFGYPLIRLANLYLYYAEALNEINGPSAEAYSYIDQVRARSGLAGVVESWQNFSANPTKPSTQAGLREIIKSERTSEFALEGMRFWDLLRWKDAVTELNTPITGWDINQANDNGFYRITLFYTRSFTERDYFTPISLNERRRNPNLVQSGGWQ